MSKALATKKVAAALLGFGMVLAFAGSASAQTTTSASTLATLQAQVQALLAQIAALQGTGTATTGTTGSGACFTFSQNLQIGSTGQQVQWVQEFLNSHGYQVAASGAGSPGNETMYYGQLTAAAVTKFQEAYAAQILAPEGLTAGTGNWYTGTRNEANALCAAGTTSTTGTTGTTTTGGGITVTAGTQPANSLAPALANRVPFTTFTLTNTSGAAVTVNGIDVQRTGLAADAAFAGVELIDPNGLQIGTSRTFNSDDQTEVGTPFTLNPGQSETFTIAGNMQDQATEENYAGQVASISVVGIDTTVPVSGTLPITGAQQTINSSLTIGTAVAQRSSYDPLSPRSEPIGTTGLIFSGIRITAGSAENEKLYSITWNQTGSVGSDDLSNLVTIVNGTSYPVTVDSTGKYYTATFPGGITIDEGQSVDAYIQGDITGSDASGRTVEFDIYRQSDVYLVGQTYGYGITPTAANLTDTAPAATNNSEFYGNDGVSYTPFYEGAQVSVTAGTLSTISNASSVGAQNISINTPEQPLGGFTTDFTGEPVQVQSLSFNVSSTTSDDGYGYLTNVSIVDQNGNVVAGPVNESSAANGDTALTFNSSVTFPVGPMTYTIEGTVPSTAANGDTYTLSTNPGGGGDYTAWGSPQGQTSGATVSLPDTEISMSTMTVEGGALTVSAASTPASTNIAPGASNFTIANINLDASQSGEDVRLGSIPIVVNNLNSGALTDSGLESDLTNCQLYNGSTPLNNQSIGGSGWSNPTGGILEANFTFQNALTIPKGTVVTLALECNVSSSIPAGAEFSAGVNPTYDSSTSLVPTGVQSGDTIDATVEQGASGTMTVGSASLAAAIDSSSPSYNPAAGGTTGVTVSAFNLQPSSDSVNLQKIGLALNATNASSSDVMGATIWNGSTQVGSVIFAGSPVNGYYYATSSISTLTLPQNVQTVLTIKANLANVGPGQAGADGHIVQISLADAQGTGASSGAQVNSGPTTGTVAGVGLFRSYPTLATISSNSGTLVAASNQTLYEFSITPSAGGQGISLAQVPISVATSSGSASNGTTTVTDVQLYGFTDSAFSQPMSGTTNGGAVGSALSSLINGGVNKDNFTPIQLAAGTTYYFKVTATVAQVPGSNGTHGTVQTYVYGDTDQLTSYPFMDSESTAANAAYFIWSPNATTSPTNVGSVDWTTGYGLPGLPSTGMNATTLSN